MIRPEPPEPWPEGIEFIMLPGPNAYFEGRFAPGAQGLLAALKERGVAVAALGNPSHAYSYADSGWYGPVLLCAPDALHESAVATLADAVISAIRSRPWRGNGSTRSHLTIGRRHQDSNVVDWLDYRGPVDDLDPSLRRWLANTASHRPRGGANG